MHTKASVSMSLSLPLRRDLMVSFLLFQSGFAFLSIGTGLAAETTVTANDAAGNIPVRSAGASATGQVSASPAYPLKLSANRDYLVDQNNRPFFIVGDDAWTLITQLSDPEANEYLADRAARGFNTVWVAAADNCYQANAPCDHHGDRPFDGSDFTRFDPVYWAHVDYVIQRAAAYGIVVMLAPGFVGLDPAGGYLASYEKSSDTVMTTYGKFLGQRYKDYPNIIWALGGDADPASGIYGKLSSLATGIKSTDSAHLMTFEASRYSKGQLEPHGGYSSLDVWSGSPTWLDLNWVYQTAPTVWSGAVRNRARSPRLPPLMGEDWYELEHSMTELQVRQEGYEAILGGAYLGRIFGNDAIWTFGSPRWEAAGGPSWQSQLGSAGSVGEAKLGALFRSRETWQLIPDLNHRVLMAGYQSAPTLAVAARTRDGQSIIVYIPTRRVVTIDLRKISDPSAKAWWFHPQTAASTFIGNFPTTGPKDFDPPDQDDWVLVIDAASANLAAPGSKALGW
jgi:hypothetical protein